MAIEYPVLKIALNSGEDLSTKQYRFVKFSGTTLTTTSAETDYTIGILQNTPSANQQAEVMVLGISKLYVTSAVSPGNWIWVSAAGAGGQGSTYSAVSGTGHGGQADHNIAALCVQSGAAAGYASVLIGAIGRPSLK